MRGLDYQRVTAISNWISRWRRAMPPAACLAILCAALIAAAAAPPDEPPTDSVGVIEGESISVTGPMSVEVVQGQVKTVLRSGGDVRVKSGGARIDCGHTAGRRTKSFETGCSRQLFFR